MPFRDGAYTPEPFSDTALLLQQLRMEIDWENAPGAATEEDGANLARLEEKLLTGELPAPSWPVANAVSRLARLVEQGLVPYEGDRCVCAIALRSLTAKISPAPTEVEPCDRCGTAVLKGDHACRHCGHLMEHSC